jgi:hypothetical protein
MLSGVLMTSVAYYWPVQEAYHPLNTGWNGCSKVAFSARTTSLLSSYDKIAANGTSLLAIIGPGIAFSRSESFRVFEFLQAGGVVLLADDFGTGNSLLEALNVSARFSRKALADLYFYSKNPGFPIIVDFSASPVTEHVSSILLDHPSFINITNTSTVVKLASSSPFSFIDLNGQNQPTANETVDSYPVMASTRIGRGLMVLIADPSMFINNVIDLYDNMKFFQNLARVGNESLIFDIEHLANAPLTNWRIMLRENFNNFGGLVRGNVYVTVLVLTVLVLTFSFGLFRLTRSRGPR